MHSVPRRRPEPARPINRCTYICPAAIHRHPAAGSRGRDHGYQRHDSQCRREGRAPPLILISGCIPTWRGGRSPASSGPPSTHPPSARRCLRLQAVPLTDTRAAQTPGSDRPHLPAASGPAALVMAMVSMRRCVRDADRHSRQHGQSAGRQARRQALWLRRRSLTIEEVEGLAAVDLVVAQPQPESRATGSCQLRQHVHQHLPPTPDACKIRTNAIAAPTRHQQRTHAPLS